MTKTLLFGGFVVLLAAALLLYLPPATEPTAGLQPPPSEILPIPFIPSSLGIEEDPYARLTYEHMLLANPATGNISADMRKKELTFSKQIKMISALRSARGSRMKANTFVARGPFNVGGRTRAIGIDKTNEKTILAGGVSGGMWRSTNEGITWTRTTAPDIINSISCLTQDSRPGKTNVWYFGTGEFSLFNSARANNATPYRGDGIYKSVDGGLTWEALAATVTSRSSRFGSPFQYVYKLAINDHNMAEDELYAATVGGIYRSVNGGESWALTLGVDLLSEPEGTDLNDRTYPYFTDVAVALNGDIFAAIGTLTNGNSKSSVAGIYHSADGLEWTKITSPGFPEDFRRVVITPSPASEREVYFLVDAATPNLWKASWSTALERFQWANLSDNIPDFGGRVGEFDTQNGYNMVLAIHPENEDVIFVGGTNLYRSTDAFRTANNTSWIGGYDSKNTARQYPGHHADQHLLAFYAGNADVMLSAHDGGISRTQNNLASEVSWVSLNNGYVTSQFFTVDIPRFESSNLIVGGMQDNGTYLRSAPGENPPWDQIFTGDGAYCQTTPEGTFWYVSAQMAQIYRLTFNTRQQLTGYARVDPVNGGNASDNGYLFINPFRLDPLNSNIMYLAGGNVIWRNSNLSQITNGSQQKTALNWEKLGASTISEGQITAMDISADPEPVLFYGNSTGKVYKLAGLHNKEYIAAELTSPIFPQAFVSCISLNPSDPQKMLVTFSNYEVPSIFYSDDGGATFSDIGKNLEENPDGTGNGPSVRWGQLIPTANGKTMAVVGTSTGLYVNDALEDNLEWGKEDNEGIGNSVIPMLSYNPSDGRLVVATHGNGVFETYISNFMPVEKPTLEAPFSAGPAYPNPFVSEVKIPLSIPSKQIVRAIVHDAAGRPIKTLVWGTQFEGGTTISWDGTNVTGTPVIDGFYYCRIELESGAEKAVRFILQR